MIKLVLEDLTNEQVVAVLAALKPVEAPAVASPEAQVAPTV